MVGVFLANLVLVAIKAAYGYATGSVTISSDAIHSLLDAASNIIGLVGLHFSAAPADTGHPYGHYKFEILASAAVGLLIFAGGYELTRAAVMALFYGSTVPHVGNGGFVVVFGTIAANGVTTAIERARGKRLESPFLLADAQHTITDLLASIAVLIAFIGARAGVPWADPLGGLFVLAFVLRAGWKVLHDNLPVLFDAAVVEPAQVHHLAGDIAGVVSVHRVRSRGLRGAAHLDLHMLVDPDITVQTAHEIAHQLENHLRESLPHVTDITIHVEPSGDPEEGY